MARRRGDRRKKLDGGPSEPPSPNEPDTGPSPDETLWESKAWNNGKARKLEPGKTDPYDERLRLLDVGDGTARIDGAGSMTVGGNSPRVYIDAPNKNVKFSAEVMVMGSVKEVYLVARSNHQDKPDGFGGYYYYLNFEDKLAYFKKEISHGNDKDNTQPQGYSSRLNEVPYELKKGALHKVELFVLNDGKNVKLEGYIDDFPLNDFLDDGTITCKNDMGNYPNTAPYQGTAKWCFLRTNKPDNVAYKNVRVEAVITQSSMRKVRDDSRPRGGILQPGQLPNGNGLEMPKM